MSMGKQTLALPAGYDVTLNIGLSKGSQFSRLTVPHRLRTIAKLLPQIMHAGYITQLHLVPRSTWIGEPLIVVQGTFRHTVHMSSLLWDAIEDMEQDCIAIYNHETDAGMLYGVRAESWGEFNINFFSFIGD